MNQTRMGSLIETFVNIAIGFVVALASQIMIFPMVGIFIPLSTNVWITLWFTVISIIRGYFIRRFFNNRIKRMASSLAKQISEED